VHGQTSRQNDNGESPNSFRRRRVGRIRRQHWWW